MKKKIISSLLLLAIFGAVLFYFVFYTKNEYLPTNTEPVIVLNDLVSNSSDIKRINNNYYISFSFLKTYIDKNVIFDDDENIVILTWKDKVIRMKFEEQIFSVNNQEVFFNDEIMFIDEQPFFSITFLEANYPLRYRYASDSMRLIVDTIETYREGKLKKRCNIYSKPDSKSPIVSVVDASLLDEKIYIYDSTDEFYKIRDYNGYVGYVEKKRVLLSADMTENKTESHKIQVLSSNKILLAWDYYNQDLDETEKIRKIDGINVISPTAYSIANEFGDVKGTLRSNYIHMYHAHDCKVWPLITNSFNPDLTDVVLSSSRTREKLIHNIMIQVVGNSGVDGIVIDFEDIHLKNRDDFTQFLRELYPLLHNEGLDLGVCVTGISSSENWSLCYDRNRIGETVDYVMLMAYDQYWATSPVAGSVAEYEWVVEKVRELKELVPVDKIVLGVPLYSRLWISKEGKLSSKALVMEGVDNFLRDYQVKRYWLEDLRQYYAETEKDGAYYQLWIEDEESLSHKYELVNEYGLAGVASWRKGFEKEGLWKKLAQIVEGGRK